MNKFMRLDRVKETFFFNDHLKVSLRKLMFDFADHTPEVVWPRIVEMLMDTQVGLLKSDESYKEQLVTPEDLIDARQVLFEVWEANKGSLDDWEKAKQSKSE
jgi:hypothetical protein